MKSILCLMMLALGMSLNACASFALAPTPHADSHADQHPDADQNPDTDQHPIAKPYAQPDWSMDPA